MMSQYPHTRRSRFTVKLLLTVPLLIASGTRMAAAQFPEIDNTTRAMWLLDGEVIDRKTGKRIGDFVVTPGSLSTNDRGQTRVRWRENLARTMKNGQLRWPRTSGFSEMRFRVTAEGYLPFITHRIRRGGPYTRLRLRVDPVSGQTPPTRPDVNEPRR
ncbi:MAG: hypothetical protein AAGJ83_11260 [Planctomycetota bacterium]